MNRALELEALSHGQRMTYLAAIRTAIVALAFSVLVCALMVANYVQLRVNDPLNTPALVQLRKQFTVDRLNEDIKAQVRSVDLLARKAFFTSEDHLRTGGFLLVGGIAALLISLQIMGEVRRHIPQPDGCPDGNDTWIHTVRGRRAIAGGSLALLALALVAGFLSRTELKLTGEIVSAPPAAPALDPTPTEAPKPLAPAPAAPPSRDELLRNWPGFRGPDGNGVAYGKNVPVTWDGAGGTNILWKIKTPRHGYSSPVVWGEKLFVTGGDEEIRELYCLSTADGSLLWRRSDEEVPDAPSEIPETDETTGLAAASAATDGRFVCAIFATGSILCCDLDGNLVWSRNVGLPDNHYGHSSSLLIHENVLLVQLDDNATPHMLGLDVGTGKEVWRVERNTISWSSPICVNTGKRWELIVTDSSSVASYAPLTGEYYWSVDNMSGEMGPSAAFADGWVFAVNDNAVAAGLKLGDGDPSPVWEWDETLPDTASPVATKDHVFMAASYGALVCLNAKTGEKHWEKEFDEGWYGSPVLVGDLLYATDLNGVTRIVRASGTYELVASPALGEGSSCTPAVIGDRIYLRGEDHLFAVGEKE